MLLYGLLKNGKKENVLDSNNLYDNNPNIIIWKADFS
jgi:hypothetical protein